MQTIHKVYNVVNETSTGKMEPLRESFFFWEEPVTANMFPVRLIWDMIPAVWK